MMDLVSGTFGFILNNAKSSYNCVDLRHSACAPVLQCGGDVLGRTWISIVSIGYIGRFYAFVMSLYMLFSLILQILYFTEDARVICSKAVIIFNQYVLFLQRW